MTVAFGINVTDFGADNTGKMDSTKAFEAAIAALTSPTGGMLFIPDGIYCISRTLTLTDYISLKGESRATILDFSEQATGSGIVISDYGNLQIENLQVKNAADNGIEFRPSEKASYRNFCHIRDVTVVREKDQPPDRGGSGFVSVNGWMMNFERCSASGMKDYGFYFRGFHTSTKFDTCYASGAKEGGFFLVGMVYSNIINCGSDINGGYGYFLVNCQSLTISGSGAESNRFSSVGMATSDAWTRDWPSPADSGLAGITISSFFTLNGNTSMDGNFGDYMTIYADDGHRVQGSSLNHFAKDSPGSVVKRGYQPSEYIDFPILQGGKLVA